MRKLVAIVLVTAALSVMTGCCALPDAPGPIGIPMC